MTSDRKKRRIVTRITCKRRRSSLNVCEEGQQSETQEKRSQSRNVMIAEMEAECVKLVEEYEEEERTSRHVEIH